MTAMIPETWTTTNLIIQNLKETEINRIQDLYDEGRYIHEWDGRTPDDNYITTCFTDGDIPPHGMKEQFKIQVIRLKKNGEPAGLINTYHGHPMADSFYICYIYISREMQSKGFGKEVIGELLGQVARSGYSEIRANVGLKNWPALKFWTKMGLTKINGIYGDKIFGPDKFADIELSKDLKAKS